MAIASKGDDDAQYTMDLFVAKTQSCAYRLQNYNSVVVEACANLAIAAKNDLTTNDITTMDVLVSKTQSCAVELSGAIGNIHDDV